MLSCLSLSLSCFAFCSIVWAVLTVFRQVHQSCPQIIETSMFSISYLAGFSEFDAPNRCQWKFDHYVASSWETFWVSDIDRLQSKVCETLGQSDQLNKSIQTLAKIIDFQKRIFYGSSRSDRDEELFSKMFYRYECSKPSSSPSTRIVSQYIEPLIGLLRDPLTICQHGNVPAELRVDGEAAIQSKRFFLLGPSAPYANFQGSAAIPTIAPWLHKSGSQKILVDLGASLFNGGDNPNTPTNLLGARWFYEYFRSKSLQFDRLVAFEFVQHPPIKYWSQIPDDIIGKMTFINVGVESSGKFNPWNILKSIASVTDYVVIKLDIDTPPLENALMQQIVNDSSISSLIDEMFFEMHVTVNEMIPYWGAQPGNLKDSYVLFTKLRHLGIRMHSWPWRFLEMDWKYRKRIFSLALKMFRIVFVDVLCCRALNHRRTGHVLVNS